MNNISTYILEKLYIHKGMKSKDDFAQCQDIIENVFNSYKYEYKINILKHHGVSPKNAESYFYVVIKEVLQNAEAKKITKELNIEFKNLSIPYKADFDFGKISGVKFATTFTINKIKETS